MYNCDRLWFNPLCSQMAFCVRFFFYLWFDLIALCQGINWCLSWCLHVDSNDIMDYVLVRAPPLQPGLPRPRFSLYLSFLLQYGVIIVYHRQCAILLGEKVCGIPATVHSHGKYSTCTAYRYAYEREEVRVHILWNWQNVIMWCHDMEDWEASMFTALHQLLGEHRGEIRTCFWGPLLRQLTVTCAPTAWLWFQRRSNTS